MAILENEKNEKLDAAVLMAEAEAMTGLNDYGDRSFIRPFQQFMLRSARELDFKPGGIDIFRNEMLRHLVNRLRIQNDLNRHPEILAEDVSDPIIIVGLPRSGTTKLQRILSSAPGVQKLSLWRMQNPAPFPHAVAGQPDPRRLGTGVMAMNGENAAIRAAHEMALEQADEEVFLLDFTLDQSISGVGAIYVPIFMYHQWSVGSAEREADIVGYRYLRTLLQYLQWQDGGRRDRPWIMKNCLHLAHMEALLASFPNATIVQTHRDPAVSLASLIKLMLDVWGASTVMDKRKTAAEIVGWVSTAMNRCLHARERLQLDGRILDVRYEDVRTDIMPIVGEIYRRSGRTLSAEALAAMTQWEAANEQGKLGAHHYRLDEYGLDVESINRAFSAYNEKFSTLF